MKERNAFFSNVGLYMKLALVTLLMIGGGNYAWAQKGLPYSYGFEVANNTALTNDGWTIDCKGSTGINSSGAYSGNKYFRFYPNSENQYLISPELASTATGVDVSFFYKGYGTSYPATFHVGYSTTTSDLASFTWGDEIVCASATYSSFEISYLEEVKYVAIKYTASTNYYYLFVDEFEVKAYTPYKTPKNFGYSSVTATSANLSWSNAPGSSPSSWQIKYKNSSFTPGDADGATLISDIATTSYSLSGLTPENTYYVYVRACYDGGNSEWVQVTGDSFTTLELYPKPVSFALSSITGTTATFNWSNGTGTTPSAWQIKYSEKLGFDPDSEGTLVNSISKKPYTITGLTENTTYYARIRADYGSGHYSQWNTEEVSFKPTTDITVNDGEYALSGLVILSDKVNSDMKTQTIINSSSLNTIRNRQLRKLIFYSSTANTGFGDATFDVYVKETSKTSSASYDNVTGVNVLSNATLALSGNIMEVEFAVPFNYTNNNLMITIDLNTPSTSSAGSSINWYRGAYSANISYYYDGNNKTANYAPKTTIVSRTVETAPVKIGSTGYTTFSSAWPLDLSALPSGLTAYVVASGDVDASVARLTKIETAVPANTGLILKGIAGTVYEIPVAESGYAPASNLMVGVSTLETTVDASSSKYVLVNNDGTPEFQSLEEHGATIPGGKAYLSVPGAARSLQIVIDDDGQTTGISNASRLTDNGKMRNDNFFNLNGQRVAQPTKGLYIKNGKKVVMK